MEGAHIFGDKGVNYAIFPAHEDPVTAAGISGVASLGTRVDLSLAAWLCPVQTDSHPVIAGAVVH